MLHNLVRTTSAASNIPFDFSDKILKVNTIVEGQWRNKISSPYIQTFQPTRSKHATVACGNWQVCFLEYFTARGQVLWQ